MKKYKNKEWLEREYLEKEKSMNQISSELDSGLGTISYWIKKFNIPRRSIGEAVSTAKGFSNKHKDEEWLREKYLEEEKSLREISDVCDVNNATLLYWLKKFDIPRRSTGESISLSHNDGEIYKNKNWLKDQYIDQAKSVGQIAKEQDTTRSTINGWLDNYDLFGKDDGQTMSNGKKLCPTCREWLEPEKFYKTKHQKTGLSSCCKRCSRKRKRQKRRNNPQYRLNINMGSAISGALNGKDLHHWETLVNYNLSDLKEHLEEQFEEGMTWENYGKFGWHIDHIIPKSYFNFTSPEDEEFQKCWGLENLQPLWAEDNWKKSNKLPTDPT